MLESCEYGTNDSDILSCILLLTSFGLFFLILHSDLYFKLVFMREPWVWSLSFIIAFSLSLNLGIAQPPIYMTKISYWSYRL
jgi:hypothetical protein